MNLSEVSEGDNLDPDYEEQLSTHTVTVEEWKQMFDSNSYTIEDGYAFWMVDGVETSFTAFAPPPNDIQLSGVVLHPC